MYHLVCKLKVVKGALKTFNRAHGHVIERVTELRDRLFQVQQNLIDNPSDVDLRQRESELSGNLLASLSQELDFFKVRARVRWSAKGDRCSRYFFWSMIAHHNHGKIMSL